MWIFLNNAMLSIVSPRLAPGEKPSKTVVVRARINGDIQRVFGSRVRVQINAGTDYRFRATISRERVAQVLAQAARRIAYTNFKDSVKENARHDAYMRVWGVMEGEQRRRYGPPPPLRWDDDEAPAYGQTRFPL